MFTVNELSTNDLDIIKSCLVVQHNSLDKFLDGTLYTNEVVRSTLEVQVQLRSIIRKIK